MSRFEFLFVLISIVAGLALTRLLSGLTLSFRQSARKLDIAHVLFSLGIIVLLFSIWWNSFRWEDHEVWTYWEYSLLCIYMSMFYAMAAILNPGTSQTVPRFDEIRTPFYITFIMYVFVEGTVVYFRDGHVPSEYLVMVGLQSMLMAIGIFLRKVRFDQLIAAWNLFLSVGWQFFARWVG